MEKVAIKEIAAAVGISVEAVRRACAKGKLKTAEKVGRTWAASMEEAAIIWNKPNIEEKAIDKAQDSVKTAEGKTTPEEKEKPGEKSTDSIQDKAEDIDMLKKAVAVLQTQVEQLKAEIKSLKGQGAGPAAEEKNEPETKLNTVTEQIDATMQQELQTEEHIKEFENLNGNLPFLVGNYQDRKKKWVRDKAYREALKITDLIKSNTAEFLHKYAGQLKITIPGADQPSVEEIKYYMYNLPKYLYNLFSQERSVKFFSSRLEYVFCGIRPECIIEMALVYGGDLDRVRRRENFQDIERLKRIAAKE